MIHTTDFCLEYCGEQENDPNGYIRCAFGGGFFFLLNQITRRKAPHTHTESLSFFFFSELSNSIIMSHHCHDEHCDHDHEDLPESGEQMLLYSKIDRDNVRCLNEAEPGMGKSVIKPWNERFDNSKVR